MGRNWMLLSRWIAMVCLTSVGFLWAQESETKLMAVIDVQLQGDAKNFFSSEERQYLSTAIRGQASQILGDKVEILSKASFEKLVRANVEGCTEAGCFAGFIKEIGVDLGMQPTISYAFGDLTLTMEIADSKATIASRSLSAKPTEEGKNELGKQAIVLARELFQEAIVRLKLDGKKKKKKKPAAEVVEPAVESTAELPVSDNGFSKETITTTTMKESNATPVVDLSAPIEPERDNAPQVNVEPSTPAKPMSSKRKWALALWGGALGFAGVGYGSDQKALTFSKDYDAALVSFNSNPTDATANELQTAYDNVNQWKNIRTIGYSFSVLSFLVGTVLWFMPEEN